jgi:hypothetical protein
MNEFAQKLWHGEPLAWGTMGVIVACIAFLAAYQRITGVSLVKSRRERRETRHRQKRVVWEYERGD